MTYCGIHNFGKQERANHWHGMFVTGGVTYHNSVRVQKHAAESLCIRAWCVHVLQVQHLIVTPIVQIIVIVATIVYPAE